MLVDLVRIENLNNLRHYVNQTLCNQNELEIGAFHMTERILIQGGQPCGIFFCLHGPRSVRLTAIWETGQNTVLFYASTGERLQKTQLTPASAPEPVAA